MDDKKYKQAEYFKAKYQSLSTAAEFIRSHGEEGFSFVNESFTNCYFRQNKILAEQLDRRAIVFLKKYKKTGINISIEIHPDAMV